MDRKCFFGTLNDTFVSSVKWSFIDRYFSSFARHSLRNRDFSILGNNCFAGGIYHKFGLKYLTPTIWTYIFPDDYLRFLKKLEWYLKQPLEFIPSSNHNMSKQYTKLTGHTYPIGLLGKDIEIHFMHYTSQEKALEKWNTRTKRINRNNLFVVFSDGEEFVESHLERFAELPFEHKIFFSSKPRLNFEATVFVKDYSDAPFVFDLTKNRRYEKYLDLVKWLNCERCFLKR